MSPKSIRIIISGGGTGGHIYPAIAIANALKEAIPSADILFVGAEGKMEMEKVPRAGYEIVGLPVVGLKRSLSLSNLIFPFKLLRSLLKARSVVGKFRPHAAIGVGGFASGPVLMSASLAGIPTLIQEQNSYAGITNKLLAKKASVVCVAYPGMERFFPKEKIRLTGNPVRSDIVSLDGKKDTGLRHFGFTAARKILFVMGGSLGARSINESIAAGLTAVTEAGYQVLWQTGKQFIGQAQELIAKSDLAGAVKAFDFIYEMDLAYAVADVVVSRAGALSVSEICLAGKPAILIPYPYAAEDHQTQNALSLAEREAALLVNDAQAREQLVPRALTLLADSALQAKLAVNCRTMAHPHAAAEIVQELRKLLPA